MSNNVNAARNAYEKAHAEHERLAALKKSLPNGAEQNARAAAKKAAAAGRTRKQRTNRRRFTRKH